MLFHLFVRGDFQLGDGSAARQGLSKNRVKDPFPILFITPYTRSHPNPGPDPFKPAERHKEKHGNTREPHRRRFSPAHKGTVVGGL